MKAFHEIRDPIHVFVRLDSDERAVLDSRPVQRLRHLHQLALTYLVYPGATHRRFEHALGAMELAGRAFEVITREQNLDPQVKDRLPELTQPDKCTYWRRVLRMAALCHDLGHLPFSHAAEKDLLPEGWTHEDMTVQFIHSTELKALWGKSTPPLRPDDIAKLALGPKGMRKHTFSDWEALLSEVVAGDAFGVDRIDYLLRDSHHIGVAYGKFDHHRLLDTLRILVHPESGAPVLGLDAGGLHSAEALLLARYFMFTQVYYHRVRLAYDQHLIDFLGEWLPGGVIPLDVDEFMQYTDTKVTAGMLEAANDPAHSAHTYAGRIVDRQHFRRVYTRRPADLNYCQNPGRVLAGALKQEFGPENVKAIERVEGGAVVSFPVLDGNGDVVDAQELSQTLGRIPPATYDYVLVEPAIREAARDWTAKNKAAVLAAAGQAEEESDA